MKSLRLFLLPAVLLIASICVVIGSFVARVNSAGFELAGATVSLVGPMVLSTLDDVTLSSGSFDAGSALVKVSGNWTRNTGTFVPGTSTVTFRGGFLDIQFNRIHDVLFSPMYNRRKNAFFHRWLDTNRYRVFDPHRVCRQRHTGTVQLAGNYAFLTNNGINMVTNIDVQDNNAGGGQTISRGLPRLIPATMSTGPLALPHLLPLLPASRWGLSVSVDMECCLRSDRLQRVFRQCANDVDRLHHDEQLYRNRLGGYHGLRSKGHRHPRGQESSFSNSATVST